jgi:hypothetical protein
MAKSYSIQGWGSMGIVKVNNFFCMVLRLGKEGTVPWYWYFHQYRWFPVAVSVLLLELLAIMILIHRSDRKSANILTKVDMNTFLVHLQKSTALRMNTEGLYFL